MFLRRPKSGQQRSLITFDLESLRLRLPSCPLLPRKHPSKKTPIPRASTAPETPKSQATTPAAPAPATPAPSPAVLDEKTLDQIRELQRGVPNLLAKVAELYLENSALLLEELRICLNAKDAAGIAKAAHALKSTSFNTGAKDLAELCAALEALGLAARIEEAGSALEGVVHEHARVAKALEALRVAA